MHFIEPYLYLMGTIVFTVYAQIVIKWRVSGMGSLPDRWQAKLGFLFGAFTDLWVLTAFAAAFLSAVFWIAAMTKFQVSYAYPIVVGSLVMLTPIVAVLFLGESIGLRQLAGIGLVFAGMVLIGS